MPLICISSFSSHWFHAFEDSSSHSRQSTHVSNSRRRDSSLWIASWRTSLRTGSLAISCSQNLRYCWYSSSISLLSSSSSSISSFVAFFFPFLSSFAVPCPMVSCLQENCMCPILAIRGLDGPGLGERCCRIVFSLIVNGISINSPVSVVLPCSNLGGIAIVLYVAWC